MLSFFLDEDSMRRAILQALRAAGIDVVSATETGRGGFDDEAQLHFASTEGRVIYTCNVPDFTRLSTQWLRVGRHHAGIIVLTDQLTPIGAQVRALVRLAQVFEPDTMRDRVEFLRNWFE